MKEIPSIEDFINYGNERLRLLGENPALFSQWLTNKYFDWADADWHTRPNDPKKTRPILNWKSTLGQSLRYRETNKLTAVQENRTQTATQKLRERHGI